MTFYFLLYLLSIVQVSRELLSSQWKPPSFLVETVTLKSSHFGKRPYAWNQIRTTLSGPSVSKILKSWKLRTLRSWYCTSFTQSLKWMGLKSLFYRKIWGHTLYDKQLGAWIPHYLVGCTLHLGRAINYANHCHVTVQQAHSAACLECARNFPSTFCLTPKTWLAARIVKSANYGGWFTTGTCTGIV